MGNIATTTDVKEIQNQKFDIKESNFYQEVFETDGTGYELKEVSKGNKDSKFKNNFLSQNTLRFFRSIGGKETVEQGRKFDLGCTINTSISPDGTTKKITYFFY